MSVKILNKKICLLGMFSVGKTSLIRRFVHDRFDDVYLSTIGVKVTQKILAPVKDRSGEPAQYNFLIWDIEGLEKDNPVNTKYFLGAAGALVVGDLTRKETIETIPDIVKDFRRVSPDAKITLIGNKIDLINEQARDQIDELANELAADLHSPVVLTSAKTGDNVETSFMNLAKLLITNKI